MEKTTRVISSKDEDDDDDYEDDDEDSRVVLLLDEIEFLFDSLASVSHRELQTARSPAASTAALKREEFD